MNRPMMRGTQLLILLLGFVLFPTSRAGADVIRYNTYATIDRNLYSPAGTISGPNVVGFDGVTNGTFSTTSPFPLGNFIITPTSVGTTTYNHTPFDIEIDVPSLTHFDSSGPSQFGMHVGSAVIHGHLDGTVDWWGSHLVATIDSARLGTISPGPFLTVNYYYEFPVPLAKLTFNSPLNLFTGPLGGHSTFTTQVSATPEPSSLALFAAGLAGLGVWRRRGAA